MNLDSLKNRLLAKYDPSNSNPKCIQAFDLTGTENHYEVHIESSLFNGLSRIEQHQQVMSLFSNELKTGELHALSIKTKPLKG